jgi:hypothetical protein
MKPDAFIFIVAASAAAGSIGPLILWARRRQMRRKGRAIQLAVAVSGTFACAVSAWLFGKAFGATSALFASTVTILTAEWVALLHATVSVPRPSCFLKLRDGEVSLLRQRWTGVPFFGLMLRRTPLKHLGGEVYLGACSNDASRVLRGMQTAESVHIWSALCCLPLILFWAMNKAWASVGISFAVNLMLNVYPVLHLRLARGRIVKFLKSRHARRATTALPELQLETR